MSKDDNDMAIEPCQGETYPWDGKTWTVYRYGVWPRGSVNEGLTKRSFVDSSTDVDRLRRDYPEAGFSENTGYVKQELPHTPPPDFDPRDAGEVWDDADY